MSRISRNSTRVEGKPGEVQPSKQAKIYKHKLGLNLSSIKKAAVNVKNCDFLRSCSANNDKVSINRNENGLWTFSASDSSAVASLLTASSPFLTTQNFVNTSLVVVPRLELKQVNEISIVQIEKKSKRVPQKVSTRTNT